MANVNAESDVELETTVAVQVVTKDNDSFQLDIDKLKEILETDEIKDRYVVVVSIAGAFRKGKSFLLNFFIKYLNAQYKRRDVTEWLYETAHNGAFGGFASKSGRKPITSGIWMWREIFTHELANGDKIAIILIDTQGIFDHQSTPKESTTIFALSTMLSSVQCYNLKENIQEDDLQHLELFTQYGRLALNQSKETPFQKLLFIVRDWPYAEEGFGFDGQKVLDEILAETNVQSTDMHQMRENIKMNFEKIEAFLMPYPGKNVAFGPFSGTLQEIDKEFLDYVKILVPSLLAPENLAIKKINGQKVRARDWIKFLEKYFDVFSGDKLPKPTFILNATAELSNQILYDECMKHYVDKMEKMVRKVDSFIEENVLTRCHIQAENEAVAKFSEKPNIGGDKITSSFVSRIKEKIAQKYTSLKNENVIKRRNYNEYIEGLRHEIRANFESTIHR
ncbi:atlastin-like [Contarinia nasturtii]|uniref:atlastin-like n=1 Tax=Contarinia nasturtii TaxID=265458 RepID=UPI0012D39143|nr:atlastin-like [Contarinia nasturtii]